MLTAESKSVQSGNFIFSKTPIEGVILVDVQRHGDSRGYFVETYKATDFIKCGITSTFVQDNQSMSSKGVLRGLHFQINHPQSKLVRVVEGKVFDVAVDLRKGSSTYGRWFGAELSSDNLRQMYIPRGFAHGFYVLSKNAVFAYKCDDIYHPNDEGGIAWNDPDIAISWPFEMDLEPILSDKDLRHPTLAIARTELGWS